MSLKRLPTPNADAGNWGTILNEYINQLSPTPKGGINTWTTGTRPSSLTVDDEGRTGINTDTNVIERWSGTTWNTILTATSGSQTITLTGDVTGTGTSSFATTLANNSVTYSKLQNISTNNRLLGRATTGTGITEEITIGSGLSLSGSTLSTVSSVKTTITIGQTGSGADYICDGVDDQVQFQQVADYLAQNPTSTIREVLVVGGTFTFSGIVTFAIGNITIRGLRGTTIQPSSGFTDMAFTGTPPNLTADAFFCFYQTDPTKIISDVTIDNIAFNFNSKRVGGILIHPNTDIPSGNLFDVDNISGEQVLATVPVGYDVGYVYVENKTGTDQYVALGTKPSANVNYTFSTVITNYNSSVTADSDLKTILGILQNSDGSFRVNRPVDDGSIISSLTVTNNGSVPITFKLKAKASKAGDEILAPIINDITLLVSETKTFYAADFFDPTPFHTPVNIKIDNTTTGWTACSLSWVITLRKSYPALANEEIIRSAKTITIPNICIPQFRENGQTAAQTLNSAYRAVSSSYIIKKHSYLQSISLTNNSSSSVTIKELSFWDYRNQGSGRLSTVKGNFVVGANAVVTIDASTLGNIQGKYDFPFTSDCFIRVTSDSWTDKAAYEAGTSTFSVTGNFGTRRAFNREKLNRLFPKIATQDIYIVDSRNRFTTNSIKATVQLAPVCGNFVVKNCEFYNYMNMGDEGIVNIYTSMFRDTNSAKTSKCIVNGIKINNCYFHDSQYQYDTVTTTNPSNGYRCSSISLIGNYLDNVSVDNNRFERTHGWGVWTFLEIGVGLNINIRSRKNWSYSYNTCTRTKLGAWSSTGSNKLSFGRKHDFSDEGRNGFDGLKWEGNTIFDGYDNLYASELYTTSDQFDPANVDAVYNDISYYSALMCMNTRGLVVRNNKFQGVRTCLDVGYTNPYGNEGFVVDVSHNIFDNCAQLGDMDGHYNAIYDSNIFYKVSQINWFQSYGFQAPKSYRNNLIADCGYALTFGSANRALLYFRASGVTFENNTIHFSDQKTVPAIDYIMWVDSGYDPSAAAYDVVAGNNPGDVFAPIVIRNNMITGVNPASLTFYLSYNQKYIIQGNHGVIENKILCYNQYMLKSDGTYNTVILTTPKAPIGVISQNYKRSGEVINGERTILTASGNFTIDAPITELYIAKTVPEVSGVYIDTTTFKNGDTVFVKDYNGVASTYNIIITTNASGGFEGQTALVIGSNYVGIELKYINNSFQII